jgi:hypothetical protein
MWNESKVLGRISGPKRKEVIREWRIFAERGRGGQEFLFFPDILRMMKSSMIKRTCSLYGDRYAYGVLSVSLRDLNVNESVIYLKELGREYLEWIQLA